MIRFFVFFMLMGCWPDVFSQESANQLDGIDTLEVSESDFDEVSSVLAGFDYISNTSLMGRVSGVNKQPAISSYISYVSKYRFDLSVAGYYIWNSDEEYRNGSSELDLMAGYTFPITRWLQVRPYYAHYFYSNNANSVRSVYSDLIGTNLYGELKSVWINVGSGYTFGQTEEVFAMGSVGLNLEFENLFSHGDELALQPSFDVSFSNLTYYNASLISNYWFLYSFANQYPEATVADLEQAIKNPQGPNMIKLKSFFNQHKHLYNRLMELPDDMVISSIFEPEKAFTLSHIGLTLPVTYTNGRFQVNLNFSLTKPVNQPSYADDNVITYFSAGLSYLISW